MRGRPLWQPTVCYPVLFCRCLRRGDFLPLVFRRDEERCIHLSSLLLFLPSLSPFMPRLQVAVRRRLRGVLGRRACDFARGFRRSLGGGAHHRHGGGVRHRIGTGRRVCHRLCVCLPVVGGTVPPFVTRFPTGITGLRLVTVSNRDLGLATEGGEALGDLPVEFHRQGPIPRLYGCPSPHDVVGARHHLPEVFKHALHGEVSSVERQAPHPHPGTSREPLTQLQAPPAQHKSSNFEADSDVPGPNHHLPGVPPLGDDGFEMLCHRLEGSTDLFPVMGGAKPAVSQNRLVVDIFCPFIVRNLTQSNEKNSRVSQRKSFLFFFFFLVSGTPGHNAGYPIYLRLFTYIHWFTEYNNKNAF